MSVSNSSFAKASRRAEVESSSSEDEAPAVEEQVYTRPTEKVPQISAAERRRQEAARRAEDEKLIEEELKTARRQRIIDRLLRMLLIGVVIDAFRGHKPAKSGKSGKKEAKDSKDSKKGRSKAAKDSGESLLSSVRRKADAYGGPMLMLAFLVLVLGAKMAEDGYHGFVERQFDPYEVMGVARDASIIDIRKAYKTLALSWHPDKNPDCASCAEKFARISEANDILSTPEKRKAYDERRSTDGSVTSAASVDLTAEDFEATVLRSNEVWFVLVYDPHDGMSQNFHQVWEDTALSLQGAARFGRIDAMKHRKATEYMPQRVKLTPIVWSFARGQESESFLWTHEMASGENRINPFTRWVKDSYPQIRKISTASEAQYWPGQGRLGGISIEAPSVVPRRGDKGGPLRKDDIMHVQRVAHIWAGFFDFTMLDSKGSKKDAKKSSWSITYTDDKISKTVEAPNQKALHEQLQSVVADVLGEQVPHLTVRNYQQLCGGAGAVAQLARTYCLVFVNVADDEIQNRMKELNVSRTNYAQEVLDLAASEGSTADADEEAAPSSEVIHIQPVRVTSSGSRFPWQPTPPPPAFSGFWKEAGHSPIFVLELETRRVAPVRAKSLQEAYQNVAYDDLKFVELPEGMSLSRVMADPEASLRRVLLNAVTTPVGALVAFVLTAVIAAVAPELAPADCVMAAVPMFALLLVLWPAFCRRCIAVVLRSPIRS